MYHGKNVGEGGRKVSYMSKRVKGNLARRILQTVLCNCVLVWYLNVFRKTHANTNPQINMEAPGMEHSLEFLTGNVFYF